MKQVDIKKESLSLRLLHLLLLLLLSRPFFRISCAELIHSSPLVDKIYKLESAENLHNNFSCLPVHMNLQLTKNSIQSNDLLQVGILRNRLWPVLFNDLKQQINDMVEDYKSHDSLVIDRTSILPASYMYRNRVGSPDIPTTAEVS